MELLITLIGNAVVDPIFRERFLKNPDKTLDEYGFRLTKGEFEMMKAVFGNLTQQKEKKDALERAFLALQNIVHEHLSKAELTRRPCNPPCFWSIYPPGQPREYRDEWEKKAA